MLIKLNDLLMERVDFLELANGIAKAHGVKPKIKFIFDNFNDNTIKKT